MKFKYIAVNKNNSDKFDIGHYQTKVKVSIYCNTNFQVHNSTLVQARKLILSVYVYLILIIYNFYKINMITLEWFYKFYKYQ